ncbi:MAG: ribokinase [Clostridia bacterium]|nr:ribokinase [Clostridia bacterium]
MSNYRSLIIGHTTVDRNTDHLGNTVEIVGGAVVYSSASAYALGHNVLALTKIAKKDLSRLEQFTLPKENVVCIDSEKSTDMVNIYFTADKERRECSCTSRGDAFTKADIEPFEADIFHFAGLIYGDFDTEMIKYASTKGKVAVDVQGFLRHANDDGSMFFEDWKDKKEILPYITYLKTDAAEAEILTGTDDRIEAAKILHSWGADEIMITHNTEVLVYNGEELYTCPIKSRNLSGRTGRGDTTFAAYINERQISSMKEALLMATATVSLKMETPGPFKGSKADIEKYISDFYN